MIECIIFCGVHQLIVVWFTNKTHTSPFPPLLLADPNNAAKLEGSIMVTVHTHQLDLTRVKKLCARLSAKDSAVRVTYSKGNTTNHHKSVVRKMN